MLKVGKVNPDGTSVCLVYYKRLDSIISVTSWGCWIEKSLEDNPGIDIPDPVINLLKRENILEKLDAPYTS